MDLAQDVEASTVSDRCSPDEEVSSIDNLNRRTTLSVVYQLSSIVHRPSSDVLRLLSIAILLLAIGARSLPGPRTIDDSFITFRYARNILAGNGFVYNPEERVLGTTTPFYTILLTSLALFSGGTQAPLPSIALFVNTLADVLTCLLLVDLGRRLGSPRAGMAAALAWAVAPFSVTFAIGGLETSVYVLLLTGTVHAHLYKRHTLAALLAALSLLTRPDALILLAPLAVDRILGEIRDWRVEKRGIGERGVGEKSTMPQYSPNPLFPYSPKLFQEAATFLLPTLAWLMFATLYFGSPVPHSVAAKSLAYHLPPTAALARLLQHYATPFLEHLTFGVPAIAVGMVLYPFLFIVGARRALRSDPHCWPFLAYPWLYFAAFALANPLIFRWYLTPPLPAYFLVILMGVEGIIGDKRQATSDQRSAVSRKRSASQRVSESATSDQRSAIDVRRIESCMISEPITGERRRQWSAVVGRPSSVVRRPSSFVIRLSSVVLFIPILLSLRDWNPHPDHGLERPAPGMAWYQLELLYRQAAEYLAGEMGPEPEQHVLAAGDVGVLGFFTEARILDTVGLNSPVTTRYYPLDPALYTINYAVPPALILDQKPEFIVILEIYGREGLLEEPRFWDQYRLLRKIPTDIYGSDGMLIFKKYP